MQKENYKLKEIIDKGAEIGGSVTGAVVSLFFSGPIGVVGGAVAGPLFSEMYKKIGVEISDKVLGDREKTRVGATYSIAYNKIESEIKKGKSFRIDDFMKSKNGRRSGAETILEGTLMKARNEYEENKIIFYSNFIANINMDSSISFEKGNTLLRIVEQLSYRQFVILAYFKTVKKMDVINWELSFQVIEKLGLHQDFYSELMDLYHKQLLRRATDHITMSIHSIKISPFGIIFHNLLELSSIDNAEINSIRSTISEIKSHLE